MTIAVSGYYGFRNTGDEAVLAGSLVGFRRRAGIEADAFLVLSSDTVWTEATHGVRSVARTSASGVHRALSEADLVLSGGGSLFQDVTSLRSVLYYAAVLLWARRLGKRYMLFAQGVGPLRRRVARSMVRHVARRAAAITVRDPASRELLLKLGVDREIHLAADPAALLGNDGPETPDEWENRRTYVGIAPRPWKGISAEMLAEAARLFDERGATIVWMPMQPAQDQPLCEEAQRISGVGTLAYLDGMPSRAVACIRNLDALLAMRLHAAILAAACGTPVAALSYDPKVDAFMERLTLRDYSLPLERMDSGAVRQVSERLLAERDRIAGILREGATALRRDAMINIEVALNLL